MTSDFSIAVHALVYLGKNQDLISSDELAKHICTHPVRVRRVMIKLREAGLIKAKAGVDGGYRLDKEADDITLSEKQMILLCLKLRNLSQMIISM